MGTGGTISGSGKYLKEKKPDITIVGVDPVGSLYYDFVKQGRITKRFSYKVEGIGEDFFPTTMNLKILDDIVRVDDKECFLMTRDLTRLEGLFVGGSGGAAVAGAVKYARTMVEQGKATVGGRPARILVFLCDARAQVRVEDLQRRLDARERLPRGVAGHRHGARSSFRASEPHRDGEARGAHARRDRPDEGRSASASSRSSSAARCAASSARSTSCARSSAGGKTLDSPIGELVEDDYATVTPNTKIELLQSVLADAKVAIVEERDEVIGIVTKIDLIDFLAKHKTPPASVPPAA